MMISYNNLRKIVLEMLAVTPQEISYLEIIHSNMVQRCTNKKDWSYRFYGAKGVRVCRRWSGRLGCLFFIFDVLTKLGHRPPGKSKSGLSLFHLDRYPDRAGDYRIDNVRWVVMQENQRNKTSTLEYKRMMAGMSGGTFTNTSAAVLSSMEI